MGRETSGELAVGEESFPRLGWRRWRPSVLTALIALAAQACGSTSANGNVGTSNAGGSSNSGGSSNIGGGAIIDVGGTGINVGGSIAIGGGAACAVSSPLADQTVSAIG